eukprot:s1271_g7.t1
MDSRSCWTLLTEAARTGLLFRGLAPGLLRSTLANGTAMVAYKKATKPFIAIAVFRLAEAGKLELNDRLDKYIPEFGNVLVQPEGADAPVAAKRPILLKHLLCHCSGIAYAPDVDETIEDESSRAYLQLQQDVSLDAVQVKLRMVAGIESWNSYWYGFSFDVLGRVLEVVGKKRLDKVLAETVFEPLGMKHTKWAVRRDELHKLSACYAHKPTWQKLYGQIKGRMPSALRPSLVRIDGNKASQSHWLQGQECRVHSGGGFMGYLYGGLVSTVADTARFVRMLMRKGKLDDGQRFLSSSSVTALEKNRMKEGVDPVNYLGNIGTYRKNGTEYGMGGAACTYWSIDRADDTATLWFTQHVDMLLACTFSTTWPEKKHRDMEGDVLPRPFDAQLFHLPAKALALSLKASDLEKREGPERPLLAWNCHLSVICSVLEALGCVPACAGRKLRTCPELGAALSVATSVPLMQRQASEEGDPQQESRSLGDAAPSSCQGSKAVVEAKNGVICCKATDQAKLGSISFLEYVQPVLLKQAVFTTAEGQAAGVSICRLSRAGRWQQVPVSHSLPCRGFPPKLSAEMQVFDTRALAFSSSCSGALWVPLLEKAWARINGSFQAAERGDSAEALAALTGAPAKHYRLHPESAGSQWGINSMLSEYISPGSWASWAGLPSDVVRHCRVTASRPWDLFALLGTRAGTACEGEPRKPWNLAPQFAKHRRHWMQHAFASRMLTSFALVVAASSSDCNQRWHQEDLTGLYLRLSQWDREGVKETHNFYDVFSTFILLARGASFARLPSSEDEVGMDQVLRARLLDSLARLGGYPERCGICIAAEDTVSEGIDSRFRIGTAARASSLDPAVAQHVKQRLPAGKYCHALALDRRHWDDLHVSPLEIQEMFARDVVHGRQVLLLRGPSAPEDNEMRAALRFAASVRAVTVSTSMLLGALDEMIADMAVLLVGIDLLLLLGLPAGFGALLAVELSCRYSVQALDVGQLSLTAPPGTKPAAPLTTLGSKDQTPHWEPQLRRILGQHIPLNGLWEVQITTDTARLQDLVEGAWRTIEVPFAPQSHKGLATKVSASEAVWYRRMLHVPMSWCTGLGRTLWLQVDACDWECAVYLDSQPLGIHRGGYDAFRLEIPALSACSKQGTPEVRTLLVRAWDPTDEGCPFTDHPPIPCESCCESGWQPRGKQALKPGSIMYTAVTGIWRQGIFLEHLPGCHIRNLHIRVHDDAPRKLTVAVDATCEKQLYLEVRDLEGSLLGVARGPCCELHAELEQALQLWSPEDPQRYEAHVSLGADTDMDTVIRRFARRFVAVKDGRFLLNDQVLFVHGVLYQGYWPESLLTPPDSGAISRDLEMVKAAGFNTVRVHAVVMGEAFYDECDKLGLLVWQDMPAGDMRAMPTWSEGRAVAEEEIGTEAQRLKVPVSRSLFDEIRRSHESRRAFETELQAMVGALSHFASVAVWVLFNEGWGQSNTKALVQFLRGLDPSRLIDANSGWNEVEGGPLGDFADLHNYEDNSSIFGPLAMSFQNFAAWGYTVGGENGIGMLGMLSQPSAVGFRPCAHWHPSLAKLAKQAGTTCNEASLPRAARQWCGSFLALAASQKKIRTRGKRKTQRRAADEEILASNPAVETPQKDTESRLRTSATWHAKLRRVCCTCDYDMIARIAVSVGSSDGADLVEMVAYECVRRPCVFFTRVLRACRLRDVPPLFSVQLYHLVEPWLREQCATYATWEAVLYALALQALEAGEAPDEALKLLSEMENGPDPRLPEPTNAAYCILVQAVAASQGERAARQLLSRSAAFLLPTDPVIYLVLAAVHSSSNIDMAKTLVRKGEMLSRSWKTSRFLDEHLGCMITLYFASICFCISELTVELLHTVLSKDCVMLFTCRRVRYHYGRYQRVGLYNTLLAAYRSMGRLRDGFAILGVMQQHGIQPTSVSFGILQQACWGHPDAAIEIRQLLRLMEVMGVSPETINYNALIKAYSDTGQLTMALQVANRMREAGILWDRFTYQYLLCAMVGAEQAELAVRLLTGMRNDGVRPRAKHYIAVFVGLAQTGFYEDSVRVFQRLVSMGAQYASLYAYNVMMGIQCRRGDMETALQTFESIREAGMEPNAMSFRILLEGYVVAGDWISALDMQAPLQEFRDRLRRISTDASVTQSGQEAARQELINKRHWTKTYYLLIDAALWKDEWVRAVSLVKDLVDQGLPVHPVRHARLVRDLKFYYAGSEQNAGVGADADVLFLQVPDSESSTASAAGKPGKDWITRVPNIPRTVQSLEPPTTSSSEQMPLHVLAASFAPQWIYAGSSSLNLDSIPDLCKRMLGRLEGEEAFVADPQAAYSLIYTYYHTTLHRRPVVSRHIPAREEILARAEPETIESLQELFDSKGWPGRAPHGYLFMRPASANLDALLVLLGLAASHPESVLLLRSEDSENRRLLADECKTRRYRALAVTLSSTLAAMPAAALVNTRMLVASVDMQLSCSNFESYLRDALAGKTVLSQGGQLPDSADAKAGRVPALGEYGGLGYAVEGHGWSSYNSWGYGEKQVNRHWEVYATALEKLLLRLLPCICDGLGAAIYTQWNDVETEVNGLLTYDRHLKLPMEFYQEFSRMVQESAHKCVSVPSKVASLSAD